MVRQASGIPQNANTAALITTIQLTVTNNAIKPLRRSLVCQIYIGENRIVCVTLPQCEQRPERTLIVAIFNGASICGKWICAGEAGKSRHRFELVEYDESKHALCGISPFIPRERAKLARRLVISRNRVLSTEDFAVKCTPR